MNTIRIKYIHDERKYVQLYQNENELKWKSRNKIIYIYTELNFIQLTTYSYPVTKPVQYHICLIYL